MNKYKELFNNVGVLIISNFGSKILGFLLIPLYTYVLTTTEYGNFDLINTSTLLLIPILTLSISDAPIRFLFEKKEKKSEIFWISFKITFIGNLFFLALIILNKIFNVIYVINNYYILCFLLFFSNSFLQLLQSLAKGMDKIKDIAISGFINSALMILLNLFFLLYLKIGLIGYFLSNILSMLISGIYLVVKMNAYTLLENKKYDKKLEEEMIHYSKPMIFNSIGWWINNVSDRYIITFLCGVAENGIYSVAYKIPSILSALQTIFNQAWTISAIKNHDEKEINKYYNNIFSSANIFMVVLCSFLIIISKKLAQYLYLNDFYIAWKYTPFLMISIVFGTLSGILGGVFAALKKTKLISVTTITGALINTILNVILVYYIGVIGAAISTMISYYIVLRIRIIALNKEFKVMFGIKEIFSYIILIIQSIILICNISKSLLIESVFFILILVFYNKELINFTKNVFEIYKNKIILAKKGKL